MAVSHPTIIRIGILLPDSGHVPPGHAHGQNLRAKAAGIRPNGRPAMKRSAWNLLVLVLLLCFRKHKRFDGEICLLYLGGYGLGRFVIEAMACPRISPGMQVSPINRGLFFLILP